MKQRTRDNLIYVAVGLSITALVVADFIYAQSHARKMWLPSNFVFRLVGTTALLGYFVARETRRAKATVIQAFGCTLFSVFLHLLIAFAFRQTVSQISGISFSALVGLEIFLVVQLLLQVVRYLKCV